MTRPADYVHFAFSQNNRQKIRLKCSIPSIVALTGNTTSAYAVGVEVTLYFGLNLYYQFYITLRLRFVSATHLLRRYWKIKTMSYVMRTALFARCNFIAIICNRFYVELASEMSSDWRHAIKLSLSKFLPG